MKLLRCPPEQEIFPLVHDLDVILSEGESYTVEFKENPDKSLPSEVCAFANASGGRIFIGVADDGRVIGTDTGNATRSRIQDTIHQIEPNLKVNIEVHDSIIVITVPEGTRKPYSCAKGFYLRSGPNSQKLERDTIIEFFQNEAGFATMKLSARIFPSRSNSTSRRTGGISGAPKSVKCSTERQFSETSTAPPP